jgi:hypothetical protein
VATHKRNRYGDSYNNEVAKTIKEFYGEKDVPAKGTGTDRKKKDERKGAAHGKVSFKEKPKKGE